MVRCVLGPDGAVVSRVAPGRGAWICSVACVREAMTRRAFDRAWRCRVPAGDLDGLVTQVDTALTPGAAGGEMTKAGRRPAARMEEWPTAGDRPAARCR